MLRIIEKGKVGAGELVTDRLISMSVCPSTSLRSTLNESERKESQALWGTNNPPMDGRKALICL